MYELFDINGHKIQHHNLQDKSHWCKDGEKIEEAFVRLYGDTLNLAMNPEKKVNPYAPDLINTTTGQLGDLKFQATPFFKAKNKYKTDPTYAVVFNEKDKLRYETKYPDLIIYYWINWIAITFKMGATEIIAQPLHGVWKTDFKRFQTYLLQCPIHYYQQRVDDTKGNAKRSYVCDIRNEVFERLI
ncbi:hypothetical protein [Chryseobacterium sp. c4a]|uniref:hypothetical protein n=1 Tax=Chryseobacterium sp. c4a TaxID=1573582 RepID=UPI0013590D81|nr:hypothetical protein [Chryseobacterium sp. c4a]